MKTDEGRLPDDEWLALIKAGEDAGWRQVWERVVRPESTSLRSAEMMKRFSLTDGDLMGMLYDEMIGRGKIALFRGEGSLEGWLRRYARGFVLNADPNRHGEISIEGAHPDGEGESEALAIAQHDTTQLRNEAWGFTHWIFRRLWNEDPERCYVHLLKTRFALSSEQIREFLDISSAANVDQIFSRSIKFMRATWAKYDKVSS